VGHSSIEEKVTKMVQPLIAEKGLELVDVEYTKEGSHWYLRIFIDKEGGVDIDDCAMISHAVSELFDRHDPIPQAYMLEVSSPGLERPLKKDEDYVRFQGRLVSISTTEPIEGYREFTGYLKGVENDAVTLEYEGEQVTIPKRVIKKANLTFEF